MTRRIWIAPLVLTLGLLTAGCSQVDDLVDDATGGDSLPTEAAAEQTRLEIELMRDEDGEIRDIVFCSPKAASRQLATVAADHIGAPDPRDDLEEFAGAGEGEIDGNVFLWCEWDHYDEPIAGIESFGVSSGPIEGSIADYLVDMFTAEGDPPDVIDSEVVAEGHGGEVSWTCLPAVDELSAICELDWTDGTFVVSLYFIGAGVTELDGAALGEPFLAEVPAFVEAAATVLE